MPRPARRYSKRIAVWQYTANPNGYGGNTTTDTFLSNVWCEVRTIPIDKLTFFGLDTDQTYIRIFLRKNSDINYEADNIFFKYGSKTYTVNSVTEKDLDGVELEILATA